MEKSTFPTLKEIIKARANNLGFCLCGFTSIAPPTGFARYQSWVERGQYGEMKYLASPYHLETRQNPQRLADWAKTLIFFAWPYSLNRNSQDSLSGQVAGYVGQADYHSLLPAKLTQLIQEVQAETGFSFQFKVFTDSAPILERELASRAGLGWIGKNSCLISPQHGSAFLLAEMFVEVELEPDAPFSTDHCGTCQRCIQACPTQCIQPDRTLDASRCISTLTIENKGDIPADLLPEIGNHLFGCDICQSVCPWNRFAEPSGQVTSFSSEEMTEMLFFEEREFQDRFGGHPINRAKHAGWLRNLCAVVGNLKIRDSLDPLNQLAQISDNEMVIIAARQAIRKIKE